MEEDRAAKRDRLIVVTGPTAAGKTAYAIKLAEELGCEIISADSRQVYREMRIGTAVPTEEELGRVRHHMIQCRSVTEQMNAWDYEQAVMGMLPEVMRRGGGVAIVCGGSMMYVDAICRGIDEMPTISDGVRRKVSEAMETAGLQHMQEWLRRLDPEYYAKMDVQNPRRVMHAIEICLESGHTCTSLRLGQAKERPFEIERREIMLPRDILYERIDRRVDDMMAAGLEEEARGLLPYRELPPLNTVGYRELFGYFDGDYDLNEAVRLIKRNSRHYAKKQMTWLGRERERDER